MSVLHSQTSTFYWIHLTFQPRWIVLLSKTAFYSHILARSRNLYSDLVTGLRW